MEDATLMSAAALASLLLPAWPAVLPALIHLHPSWLLGGLPLRLAAAPPPSGLSKFGSIPRPTQTLQLR